MNWVQNILWMKYNSKLCDFKSLLFEHGVFIQNIFMLCFVCRDDNDSCKHSHKNV